MEFFFCCCCGFISLIFFFCFIRFSTFVLVDWEKYAKISSQVNYLSTFGTNGNVCNEFLPDDGKMNRNQIIKIIYFQCYHIWNVGLCQKSPIRLIILLIDMINDQASSKYVNQMIPCAPLNGINIGWLNSCKIWNASGWPKFIEKV